MRGKFKSGVIILFILFLSIGYLKSECKIIWTQGYDGGSWDYAYGIAVDNNGYLYVTGYSYNGSNYDYFTIKYDTSGNTIWTQRYDGGNNDIAYGIAVDNNGYLYVAGASHNGLNYDYCIIKYDTSGNTIWTQRYDGGNPDDAHKITVANDGYVYVTGASHNGSSYDYFTIKYSPSGNTIWTQRYDGGNWDDTYGIAMDNNGYLYVTGKSHNGANYDYFTIKYSPAGSTIWTQRYDSGYNEYAYGIAMDNNGYVYVTGYSHNGSNYDYFTIKYDSSGNTIWTQRYDSGTNDYAQGIAVDNNGYVYVTGGSGSSYDYCTIKYAQPLYPSPYFSSISASRIDDYVKVSWSENMVNDRGYKIYRSYDKINYDLVGIIGEGINEYIDKGVDKYKEKIYYRVVATNEANEESIEVEVNMDGVLYSIGDIVVVPNPYEYRGGEKRGITFYNVTEGIEIEIYDIRGRRVKSIECRGCEGNKIEWEVIGEDGEREVSRGIYIAKIRDEKGRKKYIVILIR